MRKGTWVALLVAATLAGCGSADGGRAVLARVGAEKITVAELEAELKSSSAPNPTDPKVRQAMLERIIDRKLLAQASREARRDHTPQAQAVKTALVEDFQADLERATVAAAAPAPTPAEVTAFIREHPEMFAGRSSFIVERLRASKPIDATLAAALKPTQTLEAAEAALKAHAVPYRRTVEELDTLRTPPQLAAAIENLPPGEPFVLPEPGGFSVGRVRTRQARPLVGRDAETVAFAVLKAQRQAEALRDRLKSLRASRVRYVAAPAKTGA